MMYKKYNLQSRPIKTLLVLSIIAVFLISINLATNFAIAEHEVLIKPLIPGDNTVHYRDVTNLNNLTNTVSIAQSEFRIGESITINVFDDAANLDPDGLDTVIAQMNSTSSNGVLAFATLTELIPNSATFTGTITLSSSTTTGSTLQTKKGDELTLVYDPKDYHESARFQAVITSSGTGVVELTDYFIDDSTKADSACPFTPVTHAVDVNVVNTTASNIFVTISYANSLGVDNFINTPNLLKIGYRDSPFAAFESLTPNGNLSGHDFFAKTVTNVNQPLNVNGQYVLGFENGCLGGGGGGLVRPSLVVNALAGIGGFGSGGDNSPPILSLGELVKYSYLDIPPVIEQIVLDQDPTVPIAPMELELFEGFDFPLTINDKGFALGGFSNTIETQTLPTNSTNTIKFTLYETTKLQHISLYMNLRDDKTQIHQSDTQILFNDGLPLMVKDPNGFFSNVTAQVNDLDASKKQAVFEINFAKEMDTSDIIVRAWDQNLNSFDTYILDAIKVGPTEEIESPFTTYEEPIIEELKSTNIPIWIRNNAGWWSEDQIGDSDFIAGLEYLIKNGIINVPGVEVGADSTIIPDWIENNAAWWSDSLITDADFIEAMQWLVANGVIKI